MQPELRAVLVVVLKMDGVGGILVFFLGRKIVAISHQDRLGPPDGAASSVREGAISSLARLGLNRRGSAR